MPVDKESKLSELMGVVRERAPEMRHRFVEWAGQCREEPAIIWRTAAVRYATYALAGIIVALILRAIMAQFAGNVPDVTYAQTADFHVSCTNAACGHDFIINREFEFDDFPVPCPKCKKATGVQSRRCFSEQCGGRWVAPKKQGDRLSCRYCDNALGEAP